MLDEDRKWRGEREWYIPRDLSLSMKRIKSSCIRALRNVSIYCPRQIKELRGANGPS